MAGWWTSNRQAYAVSYLITNGGLTPLGAAGLVSRWANVESTAQGPLSQGGYKGRAFGIAQWLGPRLTPINQDTNFDDQLAYVVEELNGSEARAGRLLRSASTVDEAARAATAYERASGWNAITNTDDFTNRTAAGIPASLAAYQPPSGGFMPAGGGNSGIIVDGGLLANVDIPISFDDPSMPVEAEPGGIAGTPSTMGIASPELALLALGALVLVSIFKRILD